MASDPGLVDRIMEAEQQRHQAGRVWQTLRRIAAELDGLRTPFAVVGALAVQHHGGVGRSTEDVDLAVSQADLITIHRRLIGRGYALKSPGSRHLRDEVTRIRIEFLVAGEFPGDGNPKPVSFPDPAGNPEVIERSRDGLPFVDLRTLIEMKLASAKSAPHRIKDRADVLELIHIHKLPPDYAEKLDPYVRQEFGELAILPPPTEPD